MDCSIRCINCMNPQIYKVKDNHHGTCEIHCRIGLTKCNICSNVVNTNDIEMINKDLQGFGTIKSICSMHNIEFQDYCTICNQESPETIHTLKRSSSGFDYQYQCINAVNIDVQVNHDVNDPGNFMIRICDYCKENSNAIMRPCKHNICEKCNENHELCVLCQLLSKNSIDIIQKRKCGQMKIVSIKGKFMANEKNIKQAEIIENSDSEDSSNEFSLRDSKEENSKVEKVSMIEKIIVEDKDENSNADKERYDKTPDAQTPGYNKAPTVEQDSEIPKAVIKKKNGSSCPCCCIT
ncbi:hypothetical protein SteCoe_17409 [Stentor coeruleus]|uniref:RING-type domain-containing protein n=1 Tax=Stentor coeruleus TaxID=5963 RepID=A0A1R2BZ05_9CILI|nr:hypothetical protein SteCoe_17409 [Stentor coeruleus]